MNTVKQWKEALTSGRIDSKLKKLYSETENNKSRYLEALDGFEEYFGSDEREVVLCSAPGRTEIGGNHTDHQHGRCLAGSVNLDIIAVVALNGTDNVRVKSQGYPEDSVSTADMEIHPEEINKSAALIRGVISKFKDNGCDVKGMDIYTVSNVLKGSGLSSSAAYEVLIASVTDYLFNGGKTSPVEIAQIGQFAESVYFGKPCGLLDQTASAVGNMVEMDFNDPKAPEVSRVDFDFSKSGYSLCIIDSGADHADLTDEYAAITRELKVISNYFGAEVLRDIPKEKIIENIPKLRELAGDRAVMRAMHFYNEDARVPMQVEALKEGSFQRFLELVNQSGRSSWMYLQNVIPAGYKEHQDVALALMLCETLLKGKGAFRVHGGGFAGTVQAFVPSDMLEEFKAGIEAVLGKESCHVLSIRPVGFSVL